MTEQNEKAHAQVGGDHYQSGLKVQWIDLMSIHQIPASEATVVKYLLRYKRKNGKEDLLKARHYLVNLQKHHGDMINTSRSDRISFENRQRICENAIDHCIDLSTYAEDNFYVDTLEIACIQKTLLGFYSEALTRLNNLIMLRYPE